MFVTFFFIITTSKNEIENNNVRETEGERALQPSLCCSFLLAEPRIMLPKMLKPVAFAEY